MNIIRLFTRHGEYCVDADELNRGINGNRALTIYTRGGQKKSLYARTHRERMQAEWGVHPANLFATKKLAMANWERILIERQGEH